MFAFFFVRSLLLKMIKINIMRFRSENLISGILFRGRLSVAISLRTKIINLSNYFD